MIRFFFILFITTLFFGALYTNQEQLVALHFLWGMQTNPLPMYLIILVGFLVGLLVSSLLFVPAWVRSMLDRRKKSKRIEQLEIDLDKMRSETIKESSLLPQNPKDETSTELF